MSGSSTCGPIEALFYDLDGTLADSCAGIEWAARGALAQAFPGHDFGPMRHLIGPPIRLILEAVVRESRLPQDAAPPDLDALEASYRALYDAHGCARAQAFPGVREGLARRQVLETRQFVVTNKPKLPTARMLEALQLAEFIEEAVSPDTREPRFASKAEAARWLVQKHALDASKVLFVGDARDDALAAQAIGARFVAAAWGYGAVHIASDVALWKVAHAFEDLDEFLGASVPAHR